MYKVISTSEHEWVISGEPTKTEYHELIHLIRRFSYGKFSIRFIGRGARRAPACYFQYLSPCAGGKAELRRFCFSLRAAKSTQIKNCVLLYRLAKTDEERKEQVADAKHWVEQYGYGYRC